MTIVRVKGFQIFRDRSSVQRCYHRATREKIDLIKNPLGSAAFFAECSRITSLGSVVGAKPGTYGLLVEKYRGSPAFLELAESTKADYLRVLNFLKPLHDKELGQISRPFVVQVRDKAVAKKGRRFGNYVRAVLSLLFAWGAERGYLKENVASGIKDIRRPRGLAAANRPWTDAERHAVLDALPAHMKAAVALMMFTGLGPKDVLTLPRTFARDGELATRRSKTGEPVFWPIPEALQAILAAAPHRDAITLFASSNGRPWTLSGFRASWRPVRLKLEADGRVCPGLTLYGLRHTVAVILREIGWDERAIADALGQKTPAMARHYAKGADLAPNMRKIGASLHQELNERGTKFVKPTG